MIENFAPRVLNKLHLLPLLNYRHSLKIGQTSVVIPIIQGIGYSNIHISESWMLNLLQVLVPLKQGVFVDIGINLGQTLIKLKSLFPQQKYLGFEPNPTCVFYCKTLIESNRFAGCEIVPAGLSDASSVVVLNGFGTSGQIDSAATIIENFRPGEEITHRQFVPVFQFEDIAASVCPEKISLVKIDVEGAELEVLSGLKSRIATDQPFIFCEILPAYRDDNSPRIARQRQIESLLAELNYSLFRVLSGNRVEEIAEFGTHGDMEQCEYLFVSVNDTSSFAAALATGGIELQLN